MYLEVAYLKDGLWVRKMVLFQVGIEAGGRRPEVRDACGWGRKDGGIPSGTLAPSGHMDLPEETKWSTIQTHPGGA
jgi:hypothetical protein